MRWLASLPVGMVRLYLNGKHVRSENAGVVVQEPVVSGQFQRGNEVASNPPPGTCEWYTDGV